MQEEVKGISKSTLMLMGWLVNEIEATTPIAKKLEIKAFSRIDILPVCSAFKDWYSDCRTPINLSKSVCGILAFINSLILI